MAAIDLSMVQELLDLCDDGDLAVFAELVEMFLRDAPERIRAVLDGCDRGDLAEVERAAHALKGSAGNLGAVAVQGLAERLMSAGRAGDRAAAATAATALATAYGDAATELRELIARLAG